MLQRLFRCFIEEFLANAALTFMNCLVCSRSPKDAALHLLTTSFMCGCSFIGIMHFLANDGEHHANAIVTLTAWIMGRVSLPTMITYLLAQLSGSAMGLYLLDYDFPQKPLDSGAGLCSLTPTKDLSEGQLFTVECFLTSLLLFAWIGIWKSGGRHGLQGKMISMGVFMMALSLAGGMLSGANMNPAKTLALAYRTNRFLHVEVYLAAQLTASFLVTMLWSTDTQLKCLC